MRSIAALQAFGALLGAYAFLATLSTAILNVVPLAALTGIVHQAWRVWKGDPIVQRRMQWLLAAQIPWFNQAALQIHYDFYLAFACTVRVGNATEPLELAFGSAMNAYLGTTEDSAFLGVNLAAVTLFIIFRNARLDAETKRGW